MSKQMLSYTEYEEDSSGKLTHVNIGLKAGVRFPQVLLDDIKNKEGLMAQMKGAYYVVAGGPADKPENQIVVKSDVAGGKVFRWELKPGVSKRVLPDNTAEGLEEAKTEEVPTVEDNIASAKEATLFETLVDCCGEANKSIGASYEDAERAIACLVSKGDMSSKALLTLCLYSTVMNRDTIGEKFAGVMSQIDELPELLKDWMHKGMVMIGDMMWHHYNAGVGAGAGIARLHGVYMKKVPGGAENFQKERVAKKDVAEIVAERVKTFRPATDVFMISDAWKMLASSKNATEKKAEQKFVKTTKWVKKSSK